MQPMKNMHLLISATFISHPLHDLSFIFSHKEGYQGGFLLGLFFGKMDVAAFILFTVRPLVPFVFLLSKSSAGLTQPQNYKQLLMVWKCSVNDTLERHKAWGLWWARGAQGGQSHWVILVLLRLHSYQKRGRQDSHQLWL